MYRILPPVCVLGLLACQTLPAGKAPSVEPTPVETTAAPPLPAIPLVDGKLAPRVVYPASGSRISVRDSTFLFGSVGSGLAALAINGTPVRVHPNGAFLAYLPVPRRDQPYFDLVVSKGSDTARVRHLVALPTVPAALPAGGPLMVDPTTVSPSGTTLRRGAEFVRVSVRASADAEVTFRTSAARAYPMRVATRDSSLFEIELPASEARAGSDIVARRGADSMRVAGPAIDVIDPSVRRLVVLDGSDRTLPDTDRVVNGRPIPGGTYKWFVLPGTRLQLSGSTNDLLRVSLDRDLDVWVPSGEARLVDAPTRFPARVVGNARVQLDSMARWSELVLPMSEPAPYSVETESDGLVLTLFGVKANSDIVNFHARDSIVERVTWEQVTDERARYRVVLREPAFGYLVFWRNGAMVLRVRRAPRVDPSRPLAGLRIAVDAGHPPAGSTGPTGLYEGDATLAIAERVRTLLQARGAEVVMTRTTPGPVALAERPVLARRADAHAFVSIHLNALPDGVNPFTGHGSGTYYFTSHSAPLARSIQHGLVRRMGLRDQGTNYDNLAVLRPTWMPAVLTEGAFVMIPEQEAALRTAEFQQAYALGVVEGLEAYFRDQWAFPKR